MRRAIIISNGYETNFDFYKSELKNDDFVICADGAINHCIKIGVIPNLWLGDFDSCNYKDVLKKYPQLSSVQTRKLNPQKDETDTHKACMIALSMGFKDIRIWCATGNRLDHTLSNIHILEYVYENGGHPILEDSKNSVRIFDNEIFVNKRRKYFSLIPLDKSVVVEKTDGLIYPLENFEMSRNISMGVSNEFEKDSAYVKIKNGFMLAVESDD